MSSSPGKRASGQLALKYLKQLLPCCAVPSEDERDGLFISQLEFERVVELKRDFDAKAAELEAKSAEFSQLRTEHTRLHAETERKENEMLGIFSRCYSAVCDASSLLTMSVLTQPQGRARHDQNQPDRRNQAALRPQQEVHGEAQRASDADSRAVSCCCFLAATPDCRECRDFLQRSLELLKKDFDQEQELVAALNGRVKAIQQESDQQKLTKAKFNVLEMEQQKQLDSMRETILQRKILVCWLLPVATVRSDFTARSVWRVSWRMSAPSTSRTRRRLSTSRPRCVGIEHAYWLNWPAYCCCQARRSHGSTR
jgi:hypothetical protein